MVNRAFIVLALLGVVPASLHAKPLTDSERKLARELYVSRGCMACHQFPKVSQAPDLSAVSEKYASVADGGEQILAALNKGSMKRWGELEMPPQAHLEQGEKELLSRWILQLHPSGEKVPSTAKRVTDNSLGAGTPADGLDAIPGPAIPKPARFIEQRNGTVIRVLDKPVVYRTYLPDAPSRAIAVGLPGDLSFGFDAQHCRLLYAWKGGFIDVSKS